MPGALALANAALAARNAGASAALPARSARLADALLDVAVAVTPEAPPAAASATMERIFGERRVTLAADEGRLRRSSRREDALSPGRGPIAPPRGRENVIVRPTS